MPPITRRELLEGMTATAAAAGLVACRPTSEGVTPGAIDHLVLVMMENRTFDHYLGSLSLLEGRDDVEGLAAGMSNPDPRGGADLEVYHATTHCVPDPPHSWDHAHAQWNEGAMDGFTVQYYARYRNRADPALVMGYQTRDDLPVTYALSDAYATCQRWHASIMGGTWPNRLYALAGQSGGMKSNTFPFGSGMSFDFPTIFDRLDDAGVSWGAFSQNASSLWLWEHLRGRDELLTFDHFAARAARGDLPAVSWVEPAFAIHDDHPPAHPMFGQIFLSTVYNALATSPAWDRTLLIVYYDEHGGFFDHVPPPTAQDEKASDGFDQLGFRIPAVVAGPWVKPGYVCDVQLEHTSVLRWLTDKYDLEPLTLRSESANDLTDLLDLDRMATGIPYAPVAIPEITLTDREIEDQCALANRRRSLDQPFLERILDRFPAPAHLDRRAEQEVVFRESLDHARRLGALRVA